MREPLLPKKKSEFGPGKDPYSTFPEESKSLIHQSFVKLSPQEERDKLMTQI